MSALAATAESTTPPASCSARSIAVRRALGRVVVTVQGELDRQRATILERVLSDLIEGQGNLHVVVHLTDVDPGDPLAVSALRLPADQARCRRAVFTVQGPGDRVSVAGAVVP